MSLGNLFFGNIFFTHPRSALSFLQGTYIFQRIVSLQSSFNSSIPVKVRVQCFLQLVPVQSYWFCGNNIWIILTKSVAFWERENSIERRGKIEKMHWRWERIRGIRTCSPRKISNLEIRKCKFLRFLQLKTLA